MRVDLSGICAAAVQRSLVPWASCTAWPATLGCPGHRAAQGSVYEKQIQIDSDRPGVNTAKKVVHNFRSCIENQVESATENL